MSWIERLKEKWELENNWQFLIIMVVFACTGTTVVLIKKPLINLLFEDGVRPLWFQIAYWVLILPFYNIILLFYGFLFRQFDFFWKYEQKMLRRFGIKMNADKE
ncbi:DUF6787 family protein [Ekhidna sp.]|uniref:DUF6787 family protein n=1 Tax=Ekhidna sp. TaxID=2608089 RepID=UPI003298D09E